MSRQPAPYGSWSPPTGWPAPPPIAQPERRWIWCLVGSLVAVVLLAAASAGLFFSKVKEPLDAANDYMRAISRHDYDEAFAQLCAANKIDSSPRALERNLQADALFANLEDWEITPFDVNRDGDQAGVTVDLDPDDSDEPDILTIDLQEIDGEWRPCGDVYGFRAESQRD